MMALSKGIPFELLYMERNVVESRSKLIYTYCDSSGRLRFAHNVLLAS